MRTCTSTYTHTYRVCLSCRTISLLIMCELGSTWLWIVFSSNLYLPFSLPLFLLFHLHFPLQKFYQALNFGMIVSSALMIWKGLMVVTGSESPIVVVLRLKHVIYIYIYTVHDYSIMEMLRKSKATQQRQSNNLPKTVHFSKAVSCSVNTLHSLWQWAMVCGW